MLGTGIGLDTQRHNFALPIPTCWYLKTRKHPTPILKFSLPNAKPKRKSVEYRFGGSQMQISRVGHVHFMFFCVDFICVGYPTQTLFQWNMGYKVLMLKAGFPQRRLEILENENGHGKVTEHEKLTKSHGILFSVMEFFQFCPKIL